MTFEKAYDPCAAEERNEPGALVSQDAADA